MSARELDVLGLLARGLTTGETAGLLGISACTVKDHSKSARLKLGARNTAHAVAIALRAGMIVG